MKDSEVIIGLNLYGIGTQTLRELLKVFIRPLDIIGAGRSGLREVKGLSPQQLETILSIEQSEIDRELSYIDKHGLRVITILDHDYPANLKEIYDPPILIYVQGELRKEDKLSIAIVGSRQASFYGLENAERFGFQLASLGITVVSGMAMGIDTRAHLGALKAQQRTIAVMGSGFNHIYPAVNKELSQMISQNGAVISEFPCNTEPLKFNFPRRNRIISGLALGVLVVEAARNSGALITADFALEQGREVFSLPGKINAFNSFGTNQLIKEGAKLVTGIEDILEELNFRFNTCPAMAPLDSNQVDYRLSQSEKKLYDLINPYPLALDTILEKSNFDFSSVLVDLLNLELKGLVRQLPGRQFTRS